MQSDSRPVIRKFLRLSLTLTVILAASALLGLSIGSSGHNFTEIFDILFNRAGHDPMTATIIWQIRFPRIILAATVGATLALGGLVFQALLRNALAEPYILGVSGGSAIGAIIAMLFGLSPFFGVPIAAFIGSMGTLALVLVLSSGRSLSTINKDSLLLGGVMVNAFCGAVIMFLISITQTTQVRQILFWLMGDLSMFSVDKLPILFAIIPCFIIIFLMSRPMNLLLLGKENAAHLGINVQVIFYTLLITTSLMVSLVVCQSGLIGFVGLVIPHIFRIMLGPDHRQLVPACILGGGTYLIICDLLARTLPTEGEMPVGIITALIGAPIFIFLLWRANR
ncbi:MAG: iron ABC transporter permease [Proteobacteria bacterium]|nr:iron ABC transporter permease [Pseudomonadota bacterium]MBU1715262.1 iron ABC transporter permease [Pseudomonadota bacterium]